GLGVAADDAEAVRWYRRAAEGGEANAQYILGVHEQIGLGAAKNFVDAYKWLLLAQRGGVPGAQEYVKSFARRMSPEEIAQATALADAACRESNPACRPPPPARPAPQPPPPPASHVDAQPVEGTFVVMRSTPMLDAPGSGRRVASLSQWDRLIASARTDDGWIRGKVKGKEGWVSAASVDEEATVENSEWSKVDPDDVGQLDLFLKHFPKGGHRKIAEARLAAARQATAQADAVRDAKSKAPETATGAGSPPAARQPAPPQDVAAASTNESKLGDFIDADINARPPAQRNGMAGADRTLSGSSSSSPVVDGASLAAGSSMSNSSGLVAYAPPALRQETIQAVPNAPSAMLPTGSAAELYNQAMGLLGEENYAAAQETLKKIIEGGDGGGIRQNAEYHLAEIFFRRGDYAAAAKAFADFRSAYPTNVNVPTALLDYAISLGRLGRTAEACTAFKELGIEFPGLMMGDAKDPKLSEMQRLRCPGRR
ncbi:MAG: tetratricopeptide repeat protein, partial [Hyphomicrobiales bacterium]|nr:tetratricopeptide repeat protein [Hyphomicrobiales bacterium]